MNWFPLHSKWKDQTLQLSAVTVQPTNIFLFILYALPLLYINKWHSTHASLAHWSDKNSICQAFFHKRNCAYLCHCNGFKSNCSPSCNIKDTNGIPCVIVMYKGSLTMQYTRFPRRLGLLDPYKALCSIIHQEPSTQ
jgi:hypothetical protein